MKYELGVQEYPDGWRVGLSGRDVYFLRRLTKEQAERAFCLFKDSTIDWSNLPELYEAPENIQRIIARLTVLVSVEFGIPLEELVTENQTSLALIRKSAKQRPT